ncbi:WD40/YVTN/BNR-like repeat-containing protein [Mariniradius sediminis]|uniref:YCF48-related protein n=1 Tax=Mariniradius sediminis TaxID=2909237 RepID=A0ABS9BRP3_9BACT|nr:YCF48-related protein [Mariniradius sediminis]MCF1749826.1 YCF48-related protein [Mariniradius sediminis]
MKPYTPFYILSIFLLGACFSKANKDFPESPTTWEIFETGTDISIRGLSPITEQIVWASGSKGTWLRTLDGGNTWESGIIDGLDSVDFRDIEGLDAKTAIVVAAGQPAVIYKTNDGGQTWERKYEGPANAFLDGISVNQSHIYAIGDVVDGRWMVLESRDQGETWTWLELSPDGPDGGGSFAASGSTILADGDYIWFAAAGTNSKIYWSNNKGFHWEKFEVPMLQAEDSQGIFSLERIDQSTLVAVGGDFAKPDLSENNAMISLDSGKTWNLSKGNFPTGYRSGVAYFPRYNWLIAVGPNGSDFSKNVGENWERFSDEGFHAVKLDHTKTSVWASGANGRIARLN